MIYYVVIGVLVLFCPVEMDSRIKCYSCSSENNKACIKPNKSNISLVECSLQTLQETQTFAASIRPEYRKVFEVDINDMSRNLDLNCLKQVTRVDNREYVIRGCQLAEQNQLDICHKVKTEDRSMVTTIHCSRCGSDACNSSMKYYSSSVIFIAFIWALANKLVI